MKKTPKDDKPIDQMMRMAFRHAERVLVKRPLGATLTPVFATFKNGKVDILATPWSNDHEKRIAQMLVRAKLKLENCDGYSFVSEAWMLRVDKSEYPDAERYDGVRPSQSERRVEVVAAVAVMKSPTGLDKRMATWTIVRNDKGVIVELKPMGGDYMADANVAGEMPSLMDDL
jgi:hypothetical protein